MIRSVVFYDVMTDDKMLDKVIEAGGLLILTGRILRLLLKSEGDIVRCKIFKIIDIYDPVKNLCNYRASMITVGLKANLRAFSPWLIYNSTC